MVIESQLSDGKIVSLGIPVLVSDCYYTGTMTNGSKGSPTQKFYTDFKIFRVFVDFTIDFSKISLDFSPIIVRKMINDQL